MPQANSLQAGQKFVNGRFVLVRALGRGGMGEVWLAQDERLREPVAIKFLPPEIRGDIEALEDLRRETARSHKLSHPNIVRIHDLHEEPDGTAFIVMEYVDGPTLLALRMQQPNRVMSWEAARPLLEQLCAALHYAHGERVIHRDLKPGNIMVDSRGRLKLADFGIAAVTSDSLSRVSVKNPRSGTLPFMSPQQIRGERPSSSDDIYALGATLYVLLTSKMPFYTGDLKHQILHQAPEPMRDRLAALGIQNKVPPDVAAMVLSCLAKEPEKRPPSARAVADWIGLEIEGKTPGKALGDTILPQAEAAPDEPPHEKARAKNSSGGKIFNRRSMVAIMVFAAVVALAIGIVVWKSKSGGPPSTKPGDQARASSAPVLPVGKQTPGTITPTPQDQSVPDSNTHNLDQAVSTMPAGGHSWTNSLGQVQPSSHPLAAALPTNTSPTISSQTISNSTAANPLSPHANQRWTNSLGQVFVPVPGTSVMFCIWDTRVEDYRPFVDETLRDWPKVSFGQGPTHPAVNVSYKDATAFCQWLTTKERGQGLLGKSQSYQLPTDAEWSTAAGLPKEEGGTPAQKDHMKIKHFYPWGNQWPPPKGAGNYASSLQVDNFEHTSPVGSFAANRFGLFDMGGNVWQWCQDWYDQNEQYCVLRGASWIDDDPSFTLSASRNENVPGYRGGGMGFRCVLVGVGEQEASEQARPKAQAQAKATQGSATPAPTAQCWTNSLGQVFVPVPGTGVLFCIWDTRVEDFQAFVNKTGYNATGGMMSLRSDGWKRRGDTWKSPGFDQGPTYPIVGVNWDDAHAFCQWLTEKERKAGFLGENESYRLPTDAEWSTAVGLPKEEGDTPSQKDMKIKDVYPWGNQWPPPKGAGNYGSSLQVDNFEYTSPVGSFAANRFGLFDIGGNVWQWCQDWYDEQKQYRVLRGSSWYNRDASSALLAYRHRRNPGYRDGSNGFRCVMVPGGVAR